MNNDEAIRKLQKQKSEYLEEWVDYSGVAEAYDMAIEALKGGDAEMLNEDFRPKYMQQSRQADMMLVDLNSKDGYLLDGKYKVNGCEDLTDSRIEVVRCKDCRYANECHKSVQYTRNEQSTVTIGHTPIEWCSRGKRKGGEEDDKAISI